VIYRLPGGKMTGAAMTCWCRDALCLHPCHPPSLTFTHRNAEHQP